MADVNTERISIPQFYANRHILITGGSGFIGKVLIEKILRSCPDVAGVHLILREKKGVAPADRIKAITAVPVSITNLLKSRDLDIIERRHWVCNTIDAAILFPKFLRRLFDGPIRNKMAAQCLLSSLSRPLKHALKTDTNQGDTPATFSSGQLRNFKTDFYFIFTKDLIRKHSCTTLKFKYRDSLLVKESVCLSYFNPYFNVHQAADGRSREPTEGENRQVPYHVTLASNQSA